MSATLDHDRPTLELSVSRRILVLATVVVASVSYNAATFTATAILPQMQGAMSATQDEISWTITFNILATAVFTPMTGWLVTRFGRANVQFYSLAGFTLATLMCGLAHSLDSLVIWRIVQGAAGAPLLPLGQTILIDVFPRRQHSLVISVFGMSSTVGPVIGPTLAGYLAEYYSWRWGYYMIVPVALIATIVSRFALPRGKQPASAALDWIGFLSLSAAIAATQLVLSRGQRLDWYESTEIMIETIVAAVALYVFIAHSLTAHRAGKTPFLSPRLLADKNYAIGTFLIVIFGMLNFAPMVLLPALLQNQLGYPDGLIGFVVSWRGMGVMAGFGAAIITGKFDARVGMVLGFGLQIISGLWLTHIDFNTSLQIFCANAFLQGLAVGLIWTPIATSAFWTLDPSLRADGVAVFHLMRSIGTSFFISVSVAEVVRATGTNYSRMTENVSPFNRILGSPAAMGAWSIDSLTGLAGMAREINRQAAMIGYNNAFWMYTVVSIVAIPLVFMVGRPKGT
jgi:MFS transporter, DHA2 family, multidrug resistance protein